MPFSILIVDDAAIARKLSRRCLERVGFAGATFAEATNGVEAMALLQSQTFDLVVTDLDMPEMNGEELCRKVQASGLSPIMVVLSASVEPEDRVALMESGARAVLKKPAFPPHFAYILDVERKQFRGERAALGFSLPPSSKLDPEPPKLI